MTSHRNQSTSNVMTGSRGIGQVAVSGSGLAGGSTTNTIAGFVSVDNVEFSMAVACSGLLTGSVDTRLEPASQKRAHASESFSRFHRLHSKAHSDLLDIPLDSRSSNQLQV